MWGERYKTHPTYVLGFHGCDREVGERVLAGECHIRPSNNAHDWLGVGMYFWEGSPQRALEWAQAAKANPKIASGSPVKEPFVVGAIIDLGHCCSLFDSASLSELGSAFKLLAYAFKEEGVEMPENIVGPDRLRRFRDRMVIEFMHTLRQVNKLPPYAVVRAAFGEGPALYDGAGLTARNHIQLAVRDPVYIKGYFRPIPESLK